MAPRNHGGGKTPIMPTTKELATVSKKLEEMGLGTVMKLQWRTKAMHLLPEFLAARNEEQDMRAKPESWTQDSIDKAFGFPRIFASPKQGSSIDVTEYFDRITMEGPDLDSCVNPHLGIVCRFVNALFFPQRPGRFAKKTALLVIHKYIDPEFPVEWNKMMGDTIRMAVSKVTKPTEIYIVPYLFHLYAAKGSLSDDEQKTYDEERASIVALLGGGETEAPGEEGVALPTGGEAEGSGDSGSLKGKSEGVDSGSLKRKSEGVPGLSRWARSKRLAAAQQREQLAMVEVRIRKEMDPIRILDTQQREQGDGESFRPEGNRAQQFKSQATSVLTELEQVSRNLHNQKVEVDNLRQQLDCSKTMVDKWKSDWQSLAAATTSLESQTGKDHVELARLQVELARMRGELQKKETQLDQQKTKVEDLQKAKQAAEVAVSQYKKKVEDLEAEVEVYRMGKESLKKEREIVQNQVEALKKGQEAFKKEQEAAMEEMQTRHQNAIEEMREAHQTELQEIKAQLANYAISCGERGIQTDRWNL